MSATIYDISVKAGVSPSTVSRALNGDPRVNENTRTRIMAIAKDLQYSKNKNTRKGRFLRNKKGKVIALIVTDVANPFFPEIVHGIEDLAFEHGFSVSLWNTREDPKREKDYIKSLIARDGSVAGIILGASRLPEEQIVEIAQSGMPCVLVNRLISGFPCVIGDYEFGAYRAVKHLIALGHTRIALINGLPLAQTSVWRESGYVKAFLESGLEVPKDLIVSGVPMVEGGYGAALRLFGQPDPPTAIFAYNDLVALGVYRAAREKDLFIPLNVSVIGYDDIFLCPYLDPPLTTVSQPKYAMGRIAVDLFLRLLKGEKVQGDVVKLRPDLVVRSSCTVCS